MNKKWNHRTMGTTFVFCALLGSSAQAQVVTNEFTLSGSSGDYSNYLNWTNAANSSDHHVPVAGERIVIKANKTCIVDVDSNGTLKEIDVESNAVFDIQPGKVVDVGDDGDEDQCDVEGIIYLNQAGTGDPSTLRIHKSVEFVSANDTGQIIGGLNDSQIWLEGIDTTMRSEIDIEGRLKFVDDGEFINAGLVHAHSGGTIAVTSADLEDESTGVWEVSGTSSILKMDEAASTGICCPRELDGSFIVEGGTLDIRHPAITTTGSLTFTLGVIDCTNASKTTTFDSDSN